MEDKMVSGFSRWTKEEKIDWLSQSYLDQDHEAKDILKQYWNADPKLQGLHDDFIENALSNYYLPFGVAPNFLIDGQTYVLPMVTEESSVVAAASNAAKFWSDKGGFSTQVVGTRKSGQVHLQYSGDKDLLFDFYQAHKQELIDSLDAIQANMKKRGGGLVSLQLQDLSDRLDGYYQLHATFETGDAMGANFINSCLEQLATQLERLATVDSRFEGHTPKVVMSILSNYVPDCRVVARVSCPVEKLAQAGVDGKRFAEDFVTAVNMAKENVHRAVTHNKGIMNGIDAVIVATGNDFRAIEAGMHAYAAKDGQYRSLTTAWIDRENNFHFELDAPLALGTVGGLTKLHPLVGVSMKILNHPNAEQLMRQVAVAGLAQNFAAVRSLVTTGIQKGHMKMHLLNILNQLGADEQEKGAAIKHFENETVSHSSVSNYIDTLRS